MEAPSGYSARVKIYQKCIIIEPELGREMGTNDCVKRTR